MRDGCVGRTARDVNKWETEGKERTGSRCWIRECQHALWRKARARMNAKGEKLERSEYPRSVSTDYHQSG